MAHAGAVWALTSSGSATPFVDVAQLQPRLQPSVPMEGVEVSALAVAPWTPTWRWPLASSPAALSSPYGARWGRTHEGVDVAAPIGVAVVATADGRVVQAGPRGSLGWAVELEHADGWTSRYGHLSAVDVELGQRVGAGDALGRVGQTGRATGPHLHLELRRHGEPVDPCPVLRTPQGRRACVGEAR